MKMAVAVVLGSFVPLFAYGQDACRDVLEQGLSRVDSYNRSTFGSDARNLICASSDELNRGRTSDGFSLNLPLAEGLLGIGARQSSERIGQIRARSCSSSIAVIRSDDLEWLKIRIAPADVVTAWSHCMERPSDSGGVETFADVVSPPVGQPFVFRVRWQPALGVNEAVVSEFVTVNVECETTPLAPGTRLTPQWIDLTCTRTSRDRAILLVRTRDDRGSRSRSFDALPEALRAAQPSAPPTAFERCQSNDAAGCTDLASELVRTCGNGATPEAMGCQRKSMCYRNRATALMQLDEAIRLHGEESPLTLDRKDAVARISMAQCESMATWRPIFPQSP